jgi:hypothetical protein
LKDFELLGLRPGATGDEIKAAYRSRVRELHPDVHTQSDGTIPPGTTDAFLELTEARRRALAVAGATSAAVFAQTRSSQARSSQARSSQTRSSQPRSSQTRSGTGSATSAGATPFPTQRRGSASGRTPTRDDDPMLTLLTVPQRCAGAWSAAALEVWALTVVPAARGNLAEARAVVESAGVVLPRHRTVATAHVILTLTLAGRTARRFAPLADRLVPAYHALERELPTSMVGRLPARVTQVGPPGRPTTVVAAAAGLVAGGLVVWADGHSWLLG